MRAFSCWRCIAKPPQDQEWEKADLDSRTSVSPEATQAYVITRSSASCFSNNCWKYTKETGMLAEDMVGHRHNDCKDSITASRSQSMIGYKREGCKILNTASRCHHCPS